MPIFRLLCFLLLLAGPAYGARSADRYPPDCDTLITTDGSTYLVRVGWQGDQEIQYTRCDEESGRVYALQRDKIRELKRGKSPAVAAPSGMPPVPPSASRKYQLPADTFDLLTLTDGKTYRVVILVRDYLNTYYRLYDFPLDDREYSVPNQQVRSVRLSKWHYANRTKKKTSGCLIALLIVLSLIGLMFLVLVAALA